MKQRTLNRRMFIKNSSAAVAGIALTSKLQVQSPTGNPSNKLPRWRGFNILDIFSPFPPGEPNNSKTTDDDLRWMSDWGFDFVRIPMAYPRYLIFDRNKDITKDEILKFDQKVLKRLMILFTGLINTTCMSALTFTEVLVTALMQGFMNHLTCGRTRMPRMR